MSRPPSSRVTTWPLRTDTDRERWDVWAAALAAARHPSLARVEEVSRTEDVGTLALADPDSESVTEWAARTGAPVPERLAVLRAAASALDALYAGTDTVGVAHGGVGPEAVRVAADGSTRVVGFSPVAASEDPFRAPELGPGSPATRTADSYAFARLVADVLGGPGVGATTDVHAMSQALRSSRDTRRRVRLIKAIVSALTDPPDVRPHPLTAWLASAVEGTAATEVAGIASSATSPPPAPKASVSRGRSGLVIALTAAAAAMIAVSAWAVRDNQDEGRRSPAPSVDSGEPVVVEQAWDAACGAASGIAGSSLDSELNQPTSAKDLDHVAQKTQGGRWHTGRLLVSLRAGDPDEFVTITGISLHPPSVVAPPRWRATWGTPCTPATAVDLTFAADLDGEQELVPVERKSWIGQHLQFNLTATPTVIAIDATACRENYAWNVDIDYQTDAGPGSISLERSVFTYGSAADTRSYEIGDDGPSYRGELNGPDPACDAD